MIGWRGRTTIKDLLSSLGSMGAASEPLAGPAAAWVRVCVGANEAPPCDTPSRPPASPRKDKTRLLTQKFGSKNVCHQGLGGGCLLVGSAGQTPNPSHTPGHLSTSHMHPFPTHRPPWPPAPPCRRPEHGRPLALHPFTPSMHVIYPSIHALPLNTAPSFHPPLPPHTPPPHPTPYPHTPTTGL